VVFKPSQIRRVRDIYANGIAEATEFDDPKLDWTISRAERDLSKVSMNDGCCRISVGACRLIREKLGLTGAMPSCYQGRIGGAKGNWTISAEPDSMSEDDLDIWIEINESQEKFRPHEEDLDDDLQFDNRRLTFELVRTSQPPRPSSLYLAFMTILADRGVKHAEIEQLVKGALNVESKNLIDAIEDRVKCRRWLHEQYSTTEERQRADGVVWQGGLPYSSTEKIIQLLEWGFAPSKLSYLALLIQDAVETYFTRLTKSLKIRLSRSTIVLGISDHTQTLQPGEIHIVFSKPFVDEQSGDFYPSLDGREVLVARHPAIRNSDCQKVRACNKRQLSHLVDVVVFSAIGCIPMASKLQGGDYDGMDRNVTQSIMFKIWLNLYLGDTFWLCWEDPLVKDFQNAPAPITLPEAKSFGIEVDQETLGETLTRPDPIDTFLVKNFKLRCRPSHLGRSTNLVENLSYAENNIASFGVQQVAALHDLIIDASKNGYSLSEQDYKKFIESIPTNVDTTKLNPPAYKNAIKAGFRGVLEKAVANSSWRSQSRRLNKQNIVDNLYFQTIEPAILETFSKVGEYLAKGENFIDDELRQPYLEQRNGEDEDIRAEMKLLETNLQKVRDLWVKRFPCADAAPPGQKDKGWQGADEAILEVFEFYLSVQPKDPANPKIAPWIVPRLPMEPIFWDIIKASTFYYLFGHKRKGRMVFRVAGKELGYIKAMNGGNLHLIDGRIWGLYRPGKLTVTGSREFMSGSATELSSNVDETGEKEGDRNDEDEFYSTQMD
jgi:hypothetical protein